MPIAIPTPLLEFILLGPADDRRQLQDSPILGDVWVEFAKKPADHLDLLISPYQTQPAGKVAAEIDKGLDQEADASIAYLQGLIVAKLSFRELMRVVVPMTKWWIDKWSPGTADGKVPGGGKDTSQPKHEIQKYIGKSQSVIERTLEAARVWHSQKGERSIEEWAPLERYLALTGLMLWASTGDGLERGTLEEQISYILDKADPAEIAGRLDNLATQMLKAPRQDPLVWQVSRNREALPAIARSVPAVKADAAKTLFNVKADSIAWAVIDSGIHAKHPAFGIKGKQETRIKGIFDFKNYRRIVNLSNSRSRPREENLAALMDEAHLLAERPDQADRDLQTLAEDARTGGPIHWELVERFVKLKPDAPPATNHGTHVAGIIGASKDAAEEGGSPSGDVADGMCPDIQLYDFRVLGPSMKETEFAIIAALQFIRHLNARSSFRAIHGVNLSLSIRHDVRNFACGGTPICEECERLIASGVVVVAAAGNHGHKTFETKEGSYESYAAFSITDPGNADGVITVGATHRFWPHTYGVSFFSSRGPTGDGRLKPDLVAPGERIRAPISGKEWGDLDGTSMAAPHVSGAAAMLMARYSELIGQPRRIKHILCETATDLGRERSFQGRGMLDVLRAFQSV